MTTIAIDVMSGDHSPREYVAGALRALGDDKAARALLVGQPEHIEPHLNGVAASVRGRIEIIPAATVVAMDDSPREAIRRKKDSSMRVAIDLVKEGRADACVSSGNTGALTAMAHFVLKTVAGQRVVAGVADRELTGCPAGIEQPAVCATGETQVV